MNDRRRARLLKVRRRRRNRILCMCGAGLLLIVGGVLLTVHFCGKKPEEEPAWQEAAPKAEATRRPIPLDAEAPEEEELLLVNWEHPVPYERPENLVAQEKIFGEEVALQNGAGSIDEEAGLAAREMFRAAQAEGVGRFFLSNAYRSIIAQEKLWQARLSEEPTYGSRPFESPVKVLPGACTEHTTGLALDILSEDYRTADDGYGETPEGRWLAENAWKYGFIQRYPKEKEQITGVIYEPWHYRYVGREHAESIYTQNLCLEEYLDRLPQQQEFTHELRGTNAVVIDAGHGQPDGGTTGSTYGTVEEELNLTIAEKLRTELEKRGYLVTMTRTDHDQLTENKEDDMEQRRRMITDSGQDITVSIHQNFYEEDASVSGPQVFHASGSHYGEQLAKSIQQAMNRQLSPTDPRSHTVGDFYIVRSGGAPCALVECGFLSNAEEERLLNEEAYQNRLVSAIADGIDGYFGR